MKLYQLTEEFKALNALYENGEIDAQVLADTLEGVQASFADKVRNCMMVRQSLAMEQSGIENEIARLKALLDANKKQVDSIDEYIKINMVESQQDKLDLGIFKLTLRAPVKAVNVIDESKIPSQFWRVIPEAKVVDKSALSAALKLGEIEGAELVDGKRALIIK